MNNLRLSDVLSKDELRDIRQRSDLHAFWIMFYNWAIIAVAFAVAILWTNPISILLAILIMGGRQLGIAVLMHDCAHHAHFKTIRANMFFGHWVFGGPINAPCQAYRDYHLEHHKYTGTIKDPDRGLVDKFPVSRASLKRKIIRDITGQTGLRDTIYMLKTFKWQNNAPWAVFHLGLISILTLYGAPWAYLIWWAAILFVYPVISRIRQISEHGVSINRDATDPRLNTATTLANPIEKFFVAPNSVNYHLEHHQLPAVPAYNLPKLHRLLKSRGYYDGYDCFSTSYADVLKKAVV